jgi:hypothetical protein
MPGRESQHGGQMPVDRQRAAAFDRRQPSGSFRFKDPARPLDLGQISSSS